MPDIPARLLTIPEAQKALGVGRSTIYKLIDQGEFVRVNIGTRALITATSLDAYVARLTGDAA
ncbi:hypothetical protein MAUB1S_02966 [Mycolicibacterium aubagnense]